MRAEALSALVISENDSFCYHVADCLKWVGAEKVVRLKTSAAASRELSKKRFVYSILVIQIEEDKTYDVDFIENLMNGRDMAIRMIPTVAIATVKTKNFFVELGRLGFSALIMSPISRVLLRQTFFKIFDQLQAEFRNPDITLLRRALVTNDLDFVEERCMRALQHQPDHRIYSAYLGEVYFRQEKYELSLQKAQAAIDASGLDKAFDARRLKAKVLFKLGRRAESFAELPLIMKAGPDEKSAVTGLIPLWNSYATQLKTSGQIEEALLYYSLALAELDVQGYEPQLYLNIALARFAQNLHKLSFELASQSVAAAGGEFAKAQKLIKHLEENFAAQLAATDDVDRSYDRDVQSLAAASQKKLKGARGADARGSTSHSEGSSDDLSALEAELTEETDFPNSSSVSGKKLSIKDSVFSAMEGLSADPFREDDLSHTESGASADVATLDDFGDTLDVDLNMGLDEMDFDVSADDIAAAQALREQELTELEARENEAQYDAQNAQRQPSELEGALGVFLDGEGLSDPSDLSDLAGGEDKLFDDPLQDDGAEIQEEAQDPLVSTSADELLNLLGDENLMDEICAKELSNDTLKGSSKVRKGVRSQSSSDDDEILADSEQCREASDSDFMSLMGGDASSKRAPGERGRAEEKSSGSDEAQEQFDSLADLLADAPDVEESDDVSAQGVMVEPVSKPEAKGKKGSEKGLAIKKAEKNEKEEKEENKAPESKASSKPKWETLSQEELLAYIMFEKEFPRIKIKPMKVQPIRSVAVRSLDDD